MDAAEQPAEPRQAAPSSAPRRELTERERDILAFERQWWARAGAKDQAIRDTFRFSSARDFRNDGWNVVEVGNYSQGIIPTSTAYFRPGTEEEAAARALAGKFNLRAEARFPGIANSSPGVIVMITNDYGG